MDIKINLGLMSGLENERLFNVNRYLLISRRCVEALVGANGASVSSRGRCLTR